MYRHSAMTAHTADTWRGGAVEEGKGDVNSHDTH